MLTHEEKDMFTILAGEGPRCMVMQIAYRRERTGFGKINDVVDKPLVQEHVGWVVCSTTPELCGHLFSPVEKGETELRGLKGESEVRTFDLI